MHDVTRPHIILDPPDEPLRAALDLAHILQTRDGTPREVESPSGGGGGGMPRHVRVQHDLDATQPAHELVLDATYERLRAWAFGAAQRLAHPAQREAELPCATRFRS